jgi:polyisoprenoid-binding protein YceI
MRFALCSLALLGIAVAGCSPAPAPVAPAPPGSSSTVTSDAGVSEMSEPVGTDSAEPAAPDASTTPAEETSSPSPELGPATGTPSAEAPATSGTEAAPSADAPASPETAAPATDAPKTATEDAPKTETGSGPKLEAVPVEGGSAKLGPENTKIQFVGTHVGAKPDPRVGGFAKFSGEAKVDAASKSLQAVNVDIETASLFTAIEKLTGHLKTPDFLEVREYPTARFESTKVVPGENGQAQITGNLTLHGQTKEISFPAKVNVTEEGLTLHSEFTIDRSEFGMNYGPDKVHNAVAMTVVVGEKTVPQ